MEHATLLFDMALKLEVTTSLTQGGGGWWHVALDHESWEEVYVTKGYETPGMAITEAINRLNDFDS